MRIRKTTLAATLESLDKQYPHVKITLESIAFQNNDKFGPQMEALVMKYKVLVDEGLSPKAVNADETLRKEFQSLIKNRFGLKVNLKTNSHIAMVLPNYFIKDSVIISDYLRDAAKGGSVKLPGEKELRDLSAKNLGTVNISVAKVTGWFSEQTSELWINFNQLFKDYNLSPAEVTGVILHELGHIFDAVLFLNRQHSRNQIISEVAKYLGEKKENVDVEYVYKELKKTDPKLERETVEGLLSGNAPVMGVSLFRLMVGEVDSANGDAVYDRVQFEAMSDVFGARFGYGEALVTGLEKFEAVYSDYDMSAQRAYSLMTILACTVIQLGCAIIVPSVLISIYASLMTALGVVVLGKVTGSAGKVRIYDDIRARYSRIRNQTVEHIKDQDIDKDLRANLLAQIKTIDEILEKKKVHNFFIDSLMDFINPTDRKAKASIEAQQKIEAVIANDLFVKSAQLRT